ncbi:hypothetical protein [Owenweeksia hongkongensis]|uniref:hypothetical protein n=1 Tax=Owenweeksia hongkongensis TaxID=253245 RepID=UPI003A925FAB
MSIFLLAVALLSSCEKEESQGNVFSTDGRAFFKVNGEPLNAGVKVLNRDGKLVIILEHYREQHGDLYPWETLSIDNFMKTTDSTQRIYGSGVSYSNSVTGSFATLEFYDILCDSYKVIGQDSIKNWVRIDKEKNNFNDVRGSFSMYMYKEGGCSSALYSDTILITDGQFYFSL